MTKYPLYTALSNLYEIYGIEMDEDTFETYAMAAWKKIGNKDYRIYRLKAFPVKDPDGGWYICKPCNLDAIEAITLNFESVRTIDTIRNFAFAENQPIEQWIEANKKMPNELYISGKFVKYRELGDRIYFTEPFSEVNVLYKGLYCDEDGLPYINDKELEAITAYCAYSYDYKQARMTKDSNALQFAQLEQQKWERLCSAARASMDMSQNVMNEILDAMTSWDVHNYGTSSTKPIK